MLRGRLKGMRIFVGALAAAGTLRAAQPEEEAAETAWALTAPQLHRLLTRELGWDRRRYSDWLSEMLAAALLPGPAG